MIPREPLDTGVVGKRELSEEIFRSNLVIDGGGGGAGGMMGQMGKHSNGSACVPRKKQCRRVHKSLLYFLSVCVCVCVCACLELLDKNAYEAPTPQL